MHDISYSGLLVSVKSMGGFTLGGVGLSPDKTDQNLLPGCSCQCFEQSALSEPEGWSGLLHSAFGLRLGRCLW